MTFSAEFDADDDWTAPEPPTAPEAPASPKFKYANVYEWVEQWLSRMIRREMNPLAGAGLSWDHRWWAYPEVVARLAAVHYAWEEARTSKDLSAMSSWWLNHLDPHLRVIFDSEHGPMSHANRENTFLGWPALPVTTAPPEVKAVTLGLLRGDEPPTT